MSLTSSIKKKYIFNSIQTLRTYELIMYQWIMYRWLLKKYNFKISLLILHTWNSKYFYFFFKFNLSKSTVNISMRLFLTFPFIAPCPHNFILINFPNGILLLNVLKVLEFFWSTIVGLFFWITSFAGVGRDPISVTSANKR